MLRNLAIAAALQLITISSLSDRAAAQQVVTPAPFVSSGSVTGRVHVKGDGFASNAKVRLRDVRQGRIAAETRTNGVGDFTFETVDRGLYVPEVVTDAGRTIAAGEMFSIEAGQTVSVAINAADAAVLGAGVPGLDPSTSHAAATAAGALTIAVGAATSAVQAVSSATVTAETPAPPVSGEK